MNWKKVLLVAIIVIVGLSLGLRIAEFLLGAFGIGSDSFKSLRRLTSEIIHLATAVLVMTIFGKITFEALLYFRRRSN